MRLVLLGVACLTATAFAADTIEAFGLRWKAPIAADWKLEDVPMEDMTYTMINVGEGTGGGMLKNPIPGAPSSWMAYVLVNDIKAATAKAKTLGANVMKDVTEVQDMGWLSIITDPTGAMLGLWQPKKM